jgi:hypothetical protein
MSEAISTDSAEIENAVDSFLDLGHSLFALAIIALGIETFVCAGTLTGNLIETNRFGAAIGPTLAACGVGLLLKRTLRPAALTLGTLLFAYSVVFEVPKYAAALGNMGFRTLVFELLAIATLAWVLPGRDAVPNWLAVLSRCLLAVSFIVFGVDHFLGLAFIATLVPNWIPWHVFWITFFGAGFIAAGLSIGLNFRLRWGAAGIGLMFAVWVFTLHLPRTLFGLSGGSGPHSPAEWSSLFIAIALWGGSWALAVRWEEADGHGSAGRTPTVPRISSNG